jgi:hypothetical protein
LSNAPLLPRLCNAPNSGAEIDQYDSHHCGEIKCLVYLARIEGSENRNTLLAIANSSKKHTTGNSGTQNYRPKAKAMAAGLLKGK